MYSQRYERCRATTTGDSASRALPHYCYARHIPSLSSYVRRTYEPYMGIKQLIWSTRRITFVGVLVRRVLAKMRAFPRHRPEGRASVSRYVLAANAVSRPSLIEPFPSVFGVQPVALTTAIDICNNKKCNSRGLVGWCDEGRDRLGAHAGNPAHSAGLGRRLCRRPQGPDRQCRAQTQLSNEEYQHILRIHLIRHPRSAFKNKKKAFLL